MKKILAKVLAVILTGITVFSAMPTLTYADEEQLTEELTAEEDSGIVYDAPGMEELDFSQARLIVIGSDGAFADSSISSYNSVSLYQFETVADAKLAYRYFYTYASYVTVDTQITIADDNEIYPDESDVMTEDDNPLDRITEEAGAGAGYDIALIDTGASATDAVSLISEDSGDSNGHGTAMLEAIWSQAPDASVLSIKAFDASGTADVSAVYAAFEYAINAGVRIINFSASAWATEENSIIVDEINKAVSAGIIVVGAAGNNGTDASYTVPGCVSSAYIIGAADGNGTRLVSSNYGDTVDYNVVADSTSLAAAKFSGFIAGNGLEAVSSVLNGGLIYETEYHEEEQTEEPEAGDDTDFIAADDGGGGAGGGGEGQGESRWAGCGVEYVWFDRGGWAGESAPAQGSYSFGDSDVPDAMYWTFVNQLDKQIKDAIENPGSHRVYLASGADSNVTTGLNGNQERWGILRQSYVNACNNAIVRGGDYSQNARVVGVAVTYSLMYDDGVYYWMPGPDGNYTSSVYGMEPEDWNTYWNLFDNKAGEDVMGDGYGLPAAYGWSDYVNTTDFNDAYSNETWRDYIYRIGGVDNSTQPQAWQVYVVAVTDNMPPKPTGQLKIRKYGSNNPDEWKLYGAVFEVKGTNGSVAGYLGIGGGGKGYALGLISSGAHPASNTGYSDKGDFPIADSYKNQYGWIYQDYLELPEGTYYVTEVAEPVSGLYNKDTQTKTVYVSKGGEATVTFTDTPKTAPVKVVKTTLDASCTAQLRGNSLYSQDFSGAQFRVTYTNGDGNTVTETKTTGSDGSFTVNEVLVGSTFTAVETKAPKGYALPTSQPSPITVASGSNTITAKDTPLFDPVGVLFQKEAILDETGSASDTRSYR